MMGTHAFIIPVYKESPYLERCISSLKKQSPVSDILITTSTPTQATRDLAKKYGIPYLVNSSERKGIANDWNFALLVANSEYVTIAHQDDVYESDYVGEVMKNIEGSSIVFTNYWDVVNGICKKNTLNAIVKKISLFPFLIKSSYRSKLLKKLILIFGSSICCPTVTYNTKILNGFSFSPEFRFALDWVAWLEIANMDGRFTYINKKLVKHRIHNKSETTISLDSGLAQREEFKILERIWGRAIARLFAKLYALIRKAT
ncbi:glycosyltransferase family 2 protein [Poritiphilus flavus]|uniref:Glycosyltransferase n=1 Tax=Poritiphilus flavus TaxID=2697053 RepID=A0A6L9EII5_9FLAO|nr:glycosyltransferase [Poritiphilus flavus]NAS14472.1 glycosyltransferase [Poritiphilus flavus]